MRTDENGAGKTPLLGFHPSTRLRLRSNFGTTSSHSTKRSLPNLLAYSPSSPNGKKINVRSQTSHDDSCPIQPATYGRSAISKQAARENQQISFPSTAL